MLIQNTQKNQYINYLIGVARFNTIIKELVLLTNNQFLENHSFTLRVYVEHLTICGGTAKIDGWFFSDRFLYLVQFMALSVKFMSSKLHDYDNSLLHSLGLVNTSRQNILLTFYVPIFTQSLIFLPMNLVMEENLPGNFSCF